MAAMTRRMVLYMVQKVGIPADDVHTRQRFYYQKYGTSLKGLMEEYQIDPLEYLAYVHDVNPRDFLGPSPPLAQMLEEMPLRKVIFTNADANHAERVLNALQVRSHFERIIDIGVLRFHCKPDPLTYKLALEILEVPGKQCIIVDDAPRNLIPAKDMGMTTILVDGEETPSIAIDYTVPTVYHVERVVKMLIPYGRGLL